MCIGRRRQVDRLLLTTEFRSHGPPPMLTSWRRFGETSAAHRGELRPHFDAIPASGASGGREQASAFFRTLSIRALRPAAPDAAVPPADEFQALLIARPVLEVGE